MESATITSCVAELPVVPARGEDRVRIGRNAVVVLDGASGTDCCVSVVTYVDYLAGYLIDALDSDQVAPLTEVVSRAIGLTASVLDLAPGYAPSSTVSIVRRGPDDVDILVLGDSPVYVAHDGRTDRLSDDRLARLDLPSRSRLFQHLAAGYGYDDQYKMLLGHMLREKTPHINRPDGYWIAEADAQAGDYAPVYSYPLSAVPWCAMLTDGADLPATHLGIVIEDLVAQDEDELRETLDRLHRWEEETDPIAMHLPRFKQHDDKTIVVVKFA